jgi:MFS family permease
VTAASDTLSRTGLRRVLLVLCGTEIISWGVLYYAFPVLAPMITRTTGWSTTWATAAFSAGLVTAALVGIPVGRWLDRWGPRPVMTAGSVLAVPAVLGIASARTIGWFLAAWVLAGCAMAAVLYPPAFAALTRWWGRRRVRALTAVTLVAGLASTVFAPLTALLSQHLGWRHTYVVLAVVLAVGTIPAHLFGLAGRWPAGEAEHRATPPDSVYRSRAFVSLAVALSLGAFAVYAVVVNLVPLLTGRGMATSTAALALGLGGVGQVSGRLGYARLAAVTGVRTRTSLVLAAVAVAIALLAVVPGPTVLVIVIAMLVGATRGVFTLVQATAVSDRWGATHFGRLNGLLSAPTTTAMSVAPWAGAALAGLLGGYQRVFLLLALVGVLAAAVAATSVPRPPVRRATRRRTHDR